MTLEGKAKKLQDDIEKFADELDAGDPCFRGVSFLLTKRKPPELYWCVFYHSMEKETCYYDSIEDLVRQRRDRQAINNLLFRKF